MNRVVLMPSGCLSSDGRQACASSKGSGRRGWMGTEKRNSFWAPALVSPAWGGGCTEGWNQDVFERLWHHKTH